jgi:myo-inositol-1(or 4)-monophosphatase
MTPTTPEALLLLATEIADKAGVMLMDRPATFEISSKSVAIDIATQMDKSSEKFIVDSILARRPDDGILGEEGSSRESRSGITWVIDPVDGTVNYLYGIPGWSISIAAKDSEGVIAGIVHAPSIFSTWTAIRGGGATFNGSPIFVNDPVELDRALIGTGFAYDVSKRFEQGRIAAALLPQIRDLRRMGSAAVDICNVAMGRFDGYYEAGLFEWDRAAAALIATESGAIFSTNLAGVAFCAGPYLFPRLVTAAQ